MARPQRIEFPGAFYHVTSRGNRKQPIFLSDEDMLFFLNCLREAHERFGVLIHVFSLMPNHYHLFLETPGGNLSRIMHLINLKYSCYFNLKYAYCGHTFQSRYRAILVQADEYARELASYIHLNPVRAGIVNRPHDYKWSNFGEYLGLVFPAPWTSNSFVLRLFGPSLAEARENYEAYVLRRMGQTTPDPLEPAKKTGILGNASFVDGVKKALLYGQDCRLSCEDPLPPSTVFRPELKWVLAESEAVLGSNNRYARKIAIYISHKGTDHMLSSIGEFFSIGNSGIADICRRLKKELAHNETLVRAVTEIERRLRLQMK